MNNDATFARVLCNGRIDKQMQTNDTIWIGQQVRPLKGSSEKWMLSSMLKSLQERAPSSGLISDAAGVDHAELESVLLSRMPVRHHQASGDKWIFMAHYLSLCLPWAPSTSTVWLASNRLQCGWDFTVFAMYFD